MGWTPVGGSDNSFSEYFDLRTLLHYLHILLFIKLTYLNQELLHKGTPTCGFKFYDTAVCIFLITSYQLNKMTQLCCISGGQAFKCLITN